MLSTGTDFDSSSSRHPFPQRAGSWPTCSDCPVIKLVTCGSHVIMHDAGLPLRLHRWTHSSLARSFCYCLAPVLATLVRCTLNGEIDILQAAVRAIEQAWEPLIQRSVVHTFVLQSRDQRVSGETKDINSLPRIRYLSERL